MLTSLINEMHQTGDSDGRRDRRLAPGHRPGHHRGAELPARQLLPPGCSLVVTSRTQTGLPMSRMRMRDELVEIDSTALRFDNAESRELPRRPRRAATSTTRGRRPHHATDGWVAALQLASLSLRGTRRSGSADRHAFRAPPRDRRVPRRERPRHTGTVAAGFLLVHVDHRTDLRRAGRRARRRARRRRRCSSRSRSATCSCAGWTTSGSLSPPVLPSSCAADSNVDHPDRVVELHRTASRWFADTGWSAMRWIRRSPRATRRTRWSWSRPTGSI